MFQAPFQVVVFPAEDSVLREAGQSFPGPTADKWKSWGSMAGGSGHFSFYAMV